MLPFTEWKPIGEFFRDSIDGINGFVYGSSEDDIQSEIDDLEKNEYPVLVGVIPSSHSTSESMDNRSYNDVCFFYVLETIKDRSRDEKAVVWTVTQAAIQKVEHLIMDNYETNALLRRILPNTVHYDPEFGIWNCMGYSIGFTLENDYIVGV